MTESENDRRKPYMRPPVKDRWLGGRDEEGTIEVRTEFLYAEQTGDGIFPEGRHTHAFSRGGNVTSSDWPAPYDHQNDVSDHIWRAIASFGDDADLVITVARRQPKA